MLVKVRPHLDTSGIGVYWTYSKQSGVEIVLVDNMQHR